MPRDFLHKHPEFADLIRIVAEEKGIDPCACRKSNPKIFVVQSAEDWAAKNTPCPLHGAR
jgi:hypothetical protein